MIYNVCENNIIATFIASVVPAADFPAATLLSGMRIYTGTFVLRHLRAYRTDYAVYLRYYRPNRILTQISPDVNTKRRFL